MVYGIEKRKITARVIDNLVLELESDVFDGEVLDTNVSINGKFITIIAGDTINDFVSELRLVINKFTI